MKTTNSYVTFKGFEFSFTADSYSAYPQTHWEPGSDGETEIYNVKLNGIDATELLESCIEEFETAVLNELIEQYENRD